MKNTYPSLLDRVQSILIDVVFIVTLMFIFSAVLDKFDSPPDWVRGALFFGIWGLYEPLCVSIGCTVGQYLKGIRVKSHNNPNRRINFFASFIRYVLKTLLGWISFLTITRNKERRAIHDLVSGSVMVRHTEAAYHKLAIPDID